MYLDEILDENYPEVELKSKSLDDLVSKLNNLFICEDCAAKAVEIIRQQNQLQAKKTITKHHLNQMNYSITK